MTRDELIEALLGVDSGDEEFDHIVADGLLLAYIDDSGIEEAFDAINKWYA